MIPALTMNTSVSFAARRTVTVFQVKVVFNAVFGNNVRKMYFKQRL